MISLSTRRNCFFFILCFLVSFSPHNGRNNRNNNNVCEGAFWNKKQNNNNEGDDNNEIEEEEESFDDLPDPNDKCQVFNSEGEDVTTKFYDYHHQLVNCTGELVCHGFTTTNCPNVLCKDNQACYEAKLLNVTRKVDCLGKKPCRHVEIHALVSAVATTNDNDDKEAGSAEVDEGREALSHSKVDVNCIGSGACDVAIMTNVNDVICDGNQSCRKTRIHASSILCNNGGPSQQFRACGHGATIMYKKCFICGIRDGCGTAINHCRYKHLDELDDDDLYILSSKYWSNENNWATFEKREQWTKCTSSTILGDDHQCHPKWEEQFEENQLTERLEDSVGKDSEEEEGI